MSIRIDDVEGYTLAEVTRVKVSGLQGVGSYLLVFALELLVGKVRATAELSNLAVRLESSVGGRQIIGWGNIDTNQPITINEGASRLPIHFLFQLSSRQIQALEKIRNGGDLKFNVWFSGEVHQEGKTRQFRDCSEFDISQQEWVTALGQMGFCKTLLFELRLPENEIEENASLVEIINTAKKHLNNGHYNESVGCCRKAIETVEKQLDDKKLAAKARQKYIDKPQEMNTRERIVFLREGLKNISHLAVHAHDHGDFSYQQAQAILGMTVSILSLATGEIVS